MKSITRTITILALLTAFFFLASPSKVQAASCAWKKDVSGNWGTQENWDCGKVPAPEDDVFISSGIVNLAESARVMSLTMSGGNLTGDGNLIAETITWSGGNMSGSGSTTATKEAKIIGHASMKLIDRTFNNGGTATMTWIGGIEFLELYTLGTVFNNQAGATFTIQSSAAPKVIGGPGTFNNEGRVIMDSLGETTQISAKFVNASTGVIEVVSGILQIDNNTPTTNGGGYSVLADATLHLSGAAQSLTGNIAATGEGTIEVVTGVSLDGTFTFPDGILKIPSGGGLFTLSTASTTANVGTLDLTGGVLTGPGDLTAGTINWSGGQMTGDGTTTATTALNFTGTPILTLNGRTLNNAGVATWNRTSQLTVTATSVFNNQVDATFTILDSGPGVIGGGGTVNNAGKLSKSGPVTDVTINGRFINAATGTVEVEAGKLVINNNSDGTPASSGAFHIHSGATLRLYGFPYALSGNITGTEQGTIEAAADINLDGALTFPGVITILINSTLNLSTDTTTVNIGTLDLAGGVVTGPGNLTAGTVNWSSGIMSGTGSTTATSAANFTGTSNLSLNGRTFNNKGVATWNKTGSGRLRIETAASVFNNQAGGTFTVQSAGSGITMGLGEFNNAGTLNLTTGEFNIHTFTQSSGGKTNLAISGVTPFTNYSRFVTAHANLAGELNVTFTGGYTPQVGDHYIPLTYSSDRTGDFSPVQVAPVGDILWMRSHRKTEMHLWAAKYRINIPFVKR